MLTVISYVAALLTTISFVPQAIKVIKSNNTSGISLEMYIMFTLGVFLWMIYGFYTNQVAIYLANIVTLIFAIIILTYTIRNLIKSKK